jgi:hypothetical protein
MNVVPCLTRLQGVEIMNDMPSQGSSWWSKVDDILQNLVS